MKFPSNDLFQEIKSLLHHAKNQVVHAVNSKMVHTYCKIGQLIVEHEQQGHTKAGYGSETLKILSKKLSEEFGKGFSVKNLENMRKFYLIYGKSETVSTKIQIELVTLCFSDEIN